MSTVPVTPPATESWHGEHENIIHLNLPQSNVSRSRRQVQRPSLDISSSFDCSDQSSSPSSVPSPIAGQNSQPFDADDAWNLIPYHVSWGHEYEEYRAGTLPGPEGNCIFLRSPTPLKNQRATEACKKCRERKAKCSGTRPACSRCSARGFSCQYASELEPQSAPVKSRCRRRDTAVSSKPSISRVDPARIANGQFSPDMVDFSMVGEPSVKREEVENTYALGIPLSYFPFAPTSPTSMSLESSTPSEESEEWNFSAPIHAHTSESPSSGEGDEPAMLSSYPYEVSPYPRDTFHHDDASLALLNPSIIAPLPRRHSASTSLLAADHSHLNPSFYSSPYENVEPSHNDMIVAVPCIPWDSQTLVPASEEQSLAQQYEVPTSYHLPIDTTQHSTFFPSYSESANPYASRPPPYQLHETSIAAYRSSAGVQPTYGGSSLEPAPYVEWSQIS